MQLIVHMYVAAGQAQRAAIRGMVHMFKIKWHAVMRTAEFMARIVNQLQQ